MVHNDLKSTKKSSSNHGYSAVTHFTSISDFAGRRMDIVANVSITDSEQEIVTEKVQPPLLDLFNKLNNNSANETSDEKKNSAQTTSEHGSSSSDDSGNLLKLVSYVLS